MKKTLGGDRLGSGNGMQVRLHNFERSTHNQSRKWLSTMGPGMLVPCFKEIGTNGDTFEIDINTSIRTLPTMAPLFGSFKFQCDFFATPIRLYNGLLHNNLNNIGMQMDKVLFPVLAKTILGINSIREILNLKDEQNKNPFGINSYKDATYNNTSLLNYLGIKGIVKNVDGRKDWNALEILEYYDIFKNYYANKQEKYAYVIGANQKASEEINVPITQNDIRNIDVLIKRRNWSGSAPKDEVIIQWNGETAIEIQEDDEIIITFTWEKPKGEELIKQKLDSLGILRFETYDGGNINIPSIGITRVGGEDIYIQDVLKPGNEIINEFGIARKGLNKDGKVNWIKTEEINEKDKLISKLKNNFDKNVGFGEKQIKEVQNQLKTREEIFSWLEDDRLLSTRISFIAGQGFSFNGITLPPQNIKFVNKDIKKEIGIIPFELKNIDEVRKEILKNTGLGVIPYLIKDASPLPYNILANTIEINYEGKKYKIPSTLTPCCGLVLKTYQSDMFNNWINDETIGLVNDIAAVGIVDNMLHIDDLIFSKKIYNMLNRIAISGGTWQDWQEVIYSENAVMRAEQPIYVGGASCEIVFEEVVSTSTTESQELGSLAGKGITVNKKGGKVIVKCNEPMLIMGIASITPRVSYSQGNRWFSSLKNIDQLHKPSLDAIGFQDLTLDRAAWWCNSLNGAQTILSAVGKQPAWLNYMTAVDEVYGEFEDEINYMTLTRNYSDNLNEVNFNGNEKVLPMVTDWTTYVDPSKWNYPFANARYDAQNFWVGLDFKVKSRRKMSAKQIPNL